MWYREECVLACIKTLLILFLVDNKHFARKYSLIGNDLETSETLYYTSFCIKSKEHFF